MKILNLMEDTKGAEGICYEHGLCIYVETEQHKILVDTGASKKTWENAARLGIDLKQIDAVFLSHGHYDHSGGLLSFAKENPNAKIYLHLGAGEDYYNAREEKAKYIGIDKKILELEQLVWVKEDMRIDEEISLFGNVTGRRKWPQSNLILKKATREGLIQDSFDHEQYVVIESEDKKILISGCAHNGILNILDLFREIYGSDPDLVISGFHMMKRGDYTGEEEELICDIAKELADTKTCFYTGHCTSQPAVELMYPILKERLQVMHSGERIC